MTIFGVALQMQDSDSYCKLVGQWGCATLKELSRTSRRDTIRVIGSDIQEFN